MSGEVVITCERPCSALLALFSILVLQNVVFEPVVSALPGTLSEMQTLRPTESDSAF